MHACFALFVSLCGLAEGGGAHQDGGATSALAVVLGLGMAFALLGPQVARAGALPEPAAHSAQGPAAPNTGAAAIRNEGTSQTMSHQDLLDQATTAAKAQHTIDTLPDGRIRMHAPMQALEVRIGACSAQFRSTGTGGDGAFAWHLAAWGREGQLHPAQRGQLHREGERVTVARGALQEHFTASSNGIRQDFELTQRPHGEGELLLHLTARGASVAPLDGTDQAMALTLDDGRVLHYHALQVTDATGQHLPARMALLDGQVLRIAVQDAGATYPLLVDPTFTDANWLGIAGPDLDGDIHAVAYDPVGQVLYVGGQFTTTVHGPANAVAQWDGRTWRALGAGVNGSVHALAWVPDGAGRGRLYVGGDFATAGDAPIHHVAQWDGRAWHALGAGLNGVVHDLAWAPDGAGSGHLYAGGEFTKAGGATANRVAQWDGQAWRALGAGVNGPVNAVAWARDASGHASLYAAGAFTKAGGKQAKHVAQWDGRAWHALGAGVDGPVNALAWAIDASEGDQALYVGGEFTRAGSVEANHVAQWDGRAWRALGSGVDNLVHALAWAPDASGGGRLHVGGDFNAAGGAAAARVAQWDGRAWRALGSGVNDTVNALVWAPDGAGGGRLHVGGSFQAAGGAAASHVASWQAGDERNGGGRWAALGEGVSGAVNALIWVPDGQGSGHLYVGGTRLITGSAGGASVAQWNGRAWRALGTGLMGSVDALVWAPDGLGGGRLFAAGIFQVANGADASVAEWDGRVWRVLRAGGRNVATALAWAPDGAGGGALYAGGMFTREGEATAHHVAKWDGRTWHALPEGPNDWVRALAWVPDGDGGGRLYVGGDFATAGGQPVNHVAQWDGRAWHALGQGVDGAVNALVWAPGGKGAGHGEGAVAGTLYAGGWFARASGKPAKHVAQWDGKAWGALGSARHNGVSDTVHALAWASDGAGGGRLYVGGWFTMAGGAAANHMAQWDGRAWHALGSGANRTVNALAWAPAQAGGGDVFAAGTFTQAGGQLAAIAKARMAQTPRP